MATLPLYGKPFPFGLTFVPTETLGPLVGDLSDPARALAIAAAELRASFAFVPSSAPWAAAACAELSEVEVAPLWVIDGPLWPVIHRHGVVEGLRATLTRPVEMGAEIGAGVLELIPEIDRGAGLGARAIVLAEDLAGTEGPLVAPDFAIAELLPHYARIVEAAHANRLPAILHSDGDIRALLPAVARAGFVAVHAGGGLDFEAFDRLFWAARSAKLAVMGGLITAELSNAARAEAIGSTIGVIAQAGGLLVADDGGISTATEVAGLVAALAAARSA